jgi:hypothetical protein
VSSPYDRKPLGAWRQVTESLVARHPLQPSVIVSAAVNAWNVLWQTTVGHGDLAVNLSELRVPATVVGYFFEVLLAREFERRDPRWRGSRSKDDKDVVDTQDAGQSIEIKTSGQAGFKIFGNRSYGQKLKNEQLARKDKSGYYITVNFYGLDLTLIRFGWIDADDWEPQKSPTGQMAGLKKSVYEHKLLPLRGDYRKKTPVALLDGVGEATAKKFSELGIATVGDLLRYPGQLPAALSRVVQQNHGLLDGCG